MSSSKTKHHTQSKALLEDVNALDELGRSPLHRAAFACPERVPGLLEQKANLEAQDIDGNTPLIQATRFQLNEIIWQLLAAKANPNTQNKEGWSPLKLASCQGNVRALEMLITAGVSFGLQENGENALDAALTIANNSKKKTTEYKENRQAIQQLLNTEAERRLKESKKTASTPEATGAQPSPTQQETAGGNHLNKLAETSKKPISR